MDALRTARVASMMKDELSLIINRELKDPRVPFVTITNVELTRDTKQATVFVSIISVNATHSDPDLMYQVLEALREAKGFIKKQLAAVMQLRFMPDLIFKEDKGLENTLRVNEILKQLASEKKPEASSSEASEQPTEPKKPE